VTIKCIELHSFHETQLLQIGDRIKCSYLDSMIFVGLWSWI